jgi:carboxypeptidase Q
MPRARIMCFIFAISHAWTIGKRNRTIAPQQKNKIAFVGALTAVVLFSGLCTSQDAPGNQKYQELAEKIRTAGLRGEKAFGLLEALTETAGPRLTGSPGAAAAVKFMRKHMEDLGLEVWLEPVTVQHWIRGEIEEAHIIPSRQISPHPLKVTALGWSVATPASGISAQVVEASSFEELRRLGEKVKGKIVFFNKAMDRAYLDTFRAYEEAVPYRGRGAVEAAKQGAVAVLVRSMTLRIDDDPHTGMVQYDPKVAKIPAAAISTLNAEFLSDLLQKVDSVVVNLKLSCRELPPVASANVIGEIHGTDWPDQIILLGGHLDSWDLATGAHDDGAGCAQAVEALRLIKELGLKPKRSIRAVLFMNEEFGVTGGRDYARNGRRKKEKHLAAFESDRGGFLPVWLSIGGSPDTFHKLQSLENLLKPSGIVWIRPGGGGADIGPLAGQGTVLMSLVPDSQRYFDVHHSAQDILANVNPRELELGAIVMAIVSVVLAEEGL